MRPVSTDSNLMHVVLWLLTVELDEIHCGQRLPTAMHVVLWLLTVELNEAVSRPWSVWPVSADSNTHCAVAISCKWALVGVACIS